VNVAQRDGEGLTIRLFSRLNERRPGRIPASARAVGAALVMLLGCSTRSEGAPPAREDANAKAAPQVAPTDWRPLLPAGAKVEEQLTADLDGDGTDEMIVLSSKADPDLSADSSRMNLDLTVQVFAKRTTRFVELGRTEMTGGVQPLRVATLKGADRRKVVVASALHCGGSCAGIELYVIAIKDQRVHHLLERESVDKGDFKIAPDGALEIRELVPSKGEDYTAAGYRITRYVIQGEALVAVSERRQRPKP
jgi:hypothetical protein